MVGTFAMTLINVILFKRILVRDWLSMCKKSRGQKKNNNHIVNKKEIVESETLLLDKNKFDLSNTTGNCNKLPIQSDNLSCNKNTNQNNNAVLLYLE